MTKTPQIDYASLSQGGFAAVFLRREDGSMTIFGLFIFMCMIVVVGIGVDVMRYERDRAHLQNTLDRAVLAAADLDQPLEPEAVVQDYFAKAGLSEALADVQVVSDVGSRTVTATAEQDIDTFFMHMTGIDTLSLSTVSAAREAIDAVEISLVLDVSGSMWSYSRLTNLKTAAKDFVDEMFDNSEEGTVTISIVPYATQVTAPPELFAELTTMFDTSAASAEELLAEENARKFAINEDGANPVLDQTRYDGHVLSHCINWDADDYSNTTISASTVYERTLHFDPWAEMDGWRQNPKTLIGAPVCRSDPSRQMQILSDDREALKSFIDSFYAGGNTSLDIGMKWGSILVDPSFQPIAEALSHEDVGLIDPQYANRPVAHTDSETIKVVVLMTDGQNTSQHTVNDPFRSGDSPIWFNEEVGYYSVYLGEDVDDDNGNGDTTDPLYYWPEDSDVPDSGEYHAHAYGEGTYEETQDVFECKRYRKNGNCKRWRKVGTETVTIDEPGSAEVLRYEQLWALTTQEWVAKNIFDEIIGYDDSMSEWYYNARSWLGTSTKNARTTNICNATKDNGTIVFTIGFEAPASSQTLLTNCASSPSHFFDVDGLEITDAFSAIASSIRQLRLTQ